MGIWNLVSSCLPKLSRPVIALNVRSLSSSRGGAGLDFLDSLLLLNMDLSLLLLLVLPLLLPPPPPPPPPPLLLVLLLLLLGGRGLLLSLIRFESELELEDPNFGELDLEIDFDVLLELLLERDEDDDELTDEEGTFDEGVDDVLRPEFEDEFPLLLLLLLLPPLLPPPPPLLLDCSFGRPGDEEDEDEEL